MNWRLFPAFCTALLTFVVGCNVGPDYRAPNTSTPAHWETPPTTMGSLTVQEPIEIEQWWTTFHDPMLDSLVQRAIVSNLDLEAATQRVRQARATVGIARAGIFPSVNSNASYSRSGSGRSDDQDLWQAGADAAWELDIFGGIRRSVESAKAGFQASVEDRRNVLITVLGEVATDYILLRGFQQEILIAQQNLDVQARNLSTTREKKTLGTGTDLDIAQAEAQVASTTAAIENQEANEQQTMYAISILLGLPPTTLESELMPQAPIPQPPLILPVGLPSDLLRRRPDIRRAERQLAAATAQIGVATADLFPKFSLTGNLSVGGNNFPALGNWANRSWSFGPSASWTVFDAGAIRSNIEIQNALQAQSFTAYKQTVLIALQEVQNALVVYDREQRRRAALSIAVAANQRAVELSTRRYKQGLTDFLSVLVAEGSLFGSQDSLVQSNRNIGTDAVALYKALGGGWEIGEQIPTTRAAEH
ncbi:MAG: efflux transporter outer membrane subunit [Planctomycetota bacterium]|nr:efflux transporter outer membrane subunit [Planctomycetota bacterium]